MAIICVDAGTTVIKAVAYDAAGAESAVARRETVVSRPAPGHAEQDMRAVWDAVAATVREVATGNVDFLAVTAQGDGCWLVGADLEPTGPAILWNDARAAATVDSWTREGRAAAAFRINGSSAASGLPHAILTWLRAHDPQRLDRSAAMLTCGGWIFAKLTGELVADESDASAPFMDLRARAYSPDLLTLFGLEQAERLLPPVRSCPVAELTPDAARALALTPGTPVVMAPYDIAATALGAGAVAPGQACGILGTTLCTEVVVGSPELDGEPIGITIALPGGYLRAFPTFAGTEVVQWTCRLLGLREPAELGELAGLSAPGAGGLTFLPYLSPAGERAPFTDPLARGAMLGMSFEHGREHVARAALEGLTMVIKDCLAATGAAPTELRVCGGGSANAAWLGMIADVTGLPVRRSADAEVGARGAYLVGLAATGAAPSVAAAAADHVRLRDAVEPDPGRQDFYARMFADFLTLREANAGSWPLLGELRDRS
ncbi:FGGY-family carbohydrate kinase [Nonomuraea turcica]|uniref:FGGY-family carbohydrate kinase n=1 Tax=Nonomuraea sp. G32 TaxID=3067274 RepID=UPI00273B8C90|nr:FGGY-family carbohydrate kinase [Nonomuraea sp. G32]MDP4502898.1 FGGY-family carbohydrate kinase [Nonomuraea sp. G32]